jgi:hypothetical protein
MKTDFTPLWTDTELLYQPSRPPMNSDGTPFEGLNPPIHCQLSRGIANPVEKTLDTETETAVEY